MSGERGSGSVDSDDSSHDDASTDGRHERTYRGISLRAARQYLEGLGGETVGGADEGGAATRDEHAGREDAGGSAVVAGDGWRATLSEDTVAVGPTLQLTEVTVVFEGDPETLSDLVEAFSRKALRAGG